MFSKILIANRGEIAVRVIRACKEMGIKTVAVFSEADRDTLPTALADESICIGRASAADSYLNMERIISAALATKANAIHPGYGFLSENASEAGLSTIPGTDVLESVEDALEAASKIGYPVMLKARSGGGGRGIRPAYSAEELKEVYPLATAESLAAFGDGGVYLEKCITPARHIEVQVLADEHGNAVALGERDCSIQRHHQKLLEESPSPAVSPEMREELMDKVEKAIKVIGYTGAGTLEFLMDKDGNFWFMEMNVRLQVEHGVTEILTGVDLVKWQIRIAAGVPIPFTRKIVRLRGSAIECRINALTPGVIKSLHIPGGPFVRFDTYLEPGTMVPPYYDSLIGKLMVFTGTREEAIRKMKAYLCELLIDGVKTNIEEELKIISNPVFESGNYDTSFMEGK